MMLEDKKERKVGCFEALLSSITGTDSDKESRVLDYSDAIEDLKIREIANQQLGGEFVLRVDEKAPSNLLTVETTLDDLDFSVDIDNDKLEIYTGFRVAVQAILRITLTLTTPSMETYSQVDSIDSYLDGNAFVNELNVNVTGSGDAYLRNVGTNPINKISTKVAGSGDLYIDGGLGPNQIDEIMVRVAGSGDVRINDVNVDEKKMFSKVTAVTTGSGDVCISGKNLQAKAMETKVTGSGSVRLNMEEGEIGQIVSGVSGSGDLHLGTVNAAQHLVRVAGSGDINLRCDSGTINGSIAGSGLVEYCSGPDTSVLFSTAGSGKAKPVAKANASSSLSRAGQMLPATPIRFNKVRFNF